MHEESYTALHALSTYRQADEATWATLEKVTRPEEVPEVWPHDPNPLPSQLPQLFLIFTLTSAQSNIQD